MKVEVCVTSLASARIAEAAGADRLELCSELAVGGVTPSPGLLRAVREAIRIPVHVLIRPRSGNFTYTREEIRQMCWDIEYCRGLGYEGIVTGCLAPGGDIDLPGMESLAGAAGPCHLTFHRAFDRVSGWESALPRLEALGVDTILTSGQAGSALEGLALLESLPGKTRIGIMPGGGIRPENVRHFTGKGFEAVHLSAVPPAPPDTFRGVPLNAPAMLREGEPLQADPGLIRELISVLRGS